MKIRCWLAAAAVTALVPQTASADEAVEAAIRDWIAAVDASPEWAASYGGLVYDAATDTALVTDVVITADPASPEAGAAFRMATLSVAGYVEQPDGFKVRSISADGGEAEVGFARIKLTDVHVEDLSLPFFGPFTVDEKRPFSSIMQAYHAALDIGLGSARIGSVVLDQTHEGVSSTIVYEDFRIEGWKDGKIARFDTGAVRMEAPSPDGLVRIGMNSIESRDTDLGAFVHVYDPAAYVDGVGDMIWRDALAYAAYHTVVLDVPGARINVGDIVLENFRLRQPPLSFVDYFDELISHPNMPDAMAERLAVKAVPAMFSAFSVGRFAILDTSIEAMGIDQLAIGDIHLNDFSIDGLGEFGIEGIAGVVQGQGALEVQRFAFGGITFGGYDALTRIIEATSSSPPKDIDDLMPQGGFTEIVGVELQTPDIPRLSLARFRAEIGDYAGAIPTSASVEMTGLAFPVAALPDRSTRDMLRRLGYDRLVNDFGFKGDYDPATERATIEDLHYGIQDMGSFAMSGLFAGLPMAAIGNDALMEAAIPNLRLEQARFTFTDGSIVGKGLDLLAEFMHAPAGAFRDQFADAMPFLLSIAVQNDPKLLAIVNRSGLFKKLTPVVRDFVANPGSSIIITLSPPTPVALAAIGDAVENTPDKVVEMLGLDITGEKAPATTEPTPAPPEEPGGSTPSVEPPTPPTAPGGGDGAETGGEAEGGQGKTPATPGTGGGTGGSAGGGTEGGGTEGGGQGGMTPSNPGSGTGGAGGGGQTPSNPPQRDGSNQREEMRDTMNPVQ
ncbi:MAG: hypothetical protein KDK07_17850 [Bauldia sp.]|nr:hypothetical protein [Bauldia sp.]